MVPSYDQSHVQLQLGLAQSRVMITVHLIHPWADRQLYIQRHGADPVNSLRSWTKAQSLVLFK